MLARMPSSNIIRRYNNANALFNISKRARPRGRARIVQKQHTCKGLQKTGHIAWARVNQTLPFSHGRCTARRCHSNTNLFAEMK